MFAMMNADQEYAFDGLSLTSYRERWTTNLGMILIGLDFLISPSYYVSGGGETHCCTMVEKIDVSINALNSTD